MPDDSTTSNYLEYYLHELREGDTENTYHSLIESDPSILPGLQEAFRAEPDPDMRAILVRIIWQFRLPETIPFLSKALEDDNPQVGKEALDGLVSIPCSESAAAIDKAKNRQFDSDKDAQCYRKWINEATDQVKEHLPR